MTKNSLLLVTALVASVAASAQQSTSSQPAPTTPKMQSGCQSSPAKKTRFHLPKKVQKAIAKRADDFGIDPNTPNDVLLDAQKPKPCPQPAPAPANSAPAKQ